MAKEEEKMQRKGRKDHEKRDKTEEQRKSNLKCKEVVKNEMCITVQSPINSANDENSVSTFLWTAPGERCMLEHSIANAMTTSAPTGLAMSAAPHGVLL